jgi:hypothetical protein
MTETKERQSSPFEGIALGVTFLLAGALCTWAPDFVDASDAQRTAWHVVGVALALIGGIGIATEAAQLTGAEAVSDFGYGVFLLVIAVTLALLADGWDDPPRLVSGSLKGLAGLCVLFGIYGTAVGIAKTIERGQERRRQGTKQGNSVAWLGVIAALVGLATAAVNLYEAFQSSAPPNP